MIMMSHDYSRLRLLQGEVSLLRGEVAQLKTLLLAHKDCPITLQQKSQGHLALTTSRSNNDNIVHCYSYVVAHNTAHCITITYT